MTIKQSILAAADAAAKAELDARRCECGNLKSRSLDELCGRCLAKKISEEAHARLLAPDIPEPTVPIVSPNHYSTGNHESIDVMREVMSTEEFVGFCRGNAMKYLHRMGRKGDAAKDAAKAAVYCRWLRDALEGKDDIDKSPR